MYTDIIDNIVTHANAGTVNSLARSCQAGAGIVRRRVISIADRVTIKHSIGKKRTATVHRLPNGMLHGALIDATSGVSIRWDRGRAISWTARNFFTPCTTKYRSPTMYGHRDTHNMLCINGKYQWISACDQRIGDSSVRIDIATGDITAYAGVTTLHCTAELPWPLQGYLVDDEIVPSVIDAWVKAVLETSSRRPSVSAPITMCVWRYDSDSAVDDMINQSGILTIRTL